jgi:uncharacterized protein YecE (DUF72 family)
VSVVGPPSADGASRLRVGLAGWSYDDWRDVVYPRRCKDTLRHIADFFPFVEINASFYRIPSRRTVASWVARTEQRETRFSAKLPRAITHDRKLDPATMPTFAEAFAPLVESGRFAGVLAQFSHALRADRAGLSWLEAVARALDREAGLADVPRVVELRDRSFVENDAALERIERLGFSVAHLDYPGAFDGRGIERFGPRGLAYLRLHGRNRRNWFDREAGRDATYDWEYSAAELGEVEERIRTLLERARDVIVVANNHFQGQAAKAALELLAWARGGRIAVPEPMLRRFPDLEGIAIPERPASGGGLFDPPSR